MVQSTRKTLLQQVGANIARRRKQLNLRQDQLAEMVGVETQTISRFERASHAPSLQTLERLAQVLAIEPADIVGEVSIEGTSDAELLASYLGALDPAAKAYVLKATKELCVFLAAQKI